MAVEMLFPAGQPAQDNMPMWRYMKLSTFFMLLDGKAFLPSVATLRKGDPLEGDLIPEPEFLMAHFNDVCGADRPRLLAWLEGCAEVWQRNMLRLNPHDGHLRSSIDSKLYLQELAKRRAVWCWFNADGESAGMWSIYGRGGIAVRTSLRKLKSSLPPTGQFQIALITYANRDRHSPLGYFDPAAVVNRGLIHRPHLVKGLEYRDEREIRVTTTCLPYEPGRLIKVTDPLTVVEEVVLSPLLPFEEAEAVKAQIERYPWVAPRPSIRRSSVLGRIAEEQEDMARISRILPDVLVDEEQDLPPALDRL